MYLSSQDEKRLKEASKQIGAGSAAGLLELVVMQPLDVAKTRLQLQRSPIYPDDMRSYTGILDCFSKMYSSEGLKSLWKGILPPMIAEVPRKALKFATFDQYADILEQQEIPKKLTAGLAGLCTGVTEGIVLNPLEVLKVSLQADRSSGGDQISTMDALRNTLREDGIGPRGLYRGLLATVLRNGSFNAVYFGSFFELKSKIEEYEGEEGQFVKKVLLGFTAATLATIVSIPFDVVKSRMQIRQPNPCYIKYRLTIPSLFKIMCEEGIRSLFKGLGARILRVGPGGAIIIAVYDLVYSSVQ